MEIWTDNHILLSKLDEDVAGHTAAKKALIVMRARGKLRAYQRWVKGMDEQNIVRPLKVLLIGKSGTGKSHLVDCFGKADPFPLVKVDATHLIPTGAGSGIKPDKLYDMITEAAKAMCLANPLIYPFLETTIEQTVVFIDEIDKLGTSFEGSGNWNRHVQSSFLTLFDNKDAFSGVSFVFAGAFESITGKQDVKRGIGFQHNNSATATDTSELEDRVVKSGLIPELVGRMNTIVELDTFTQEDYAKILHERILPKKARDMAAMGIFGHEMTVKDQIKLAERAEKSGQGVRFLQREVDKLFLDAEFEADYDSELLLIGRGE